MAGPRNDGEETNFPSTCRSRGSSGPPRRQSLRGQSLCPRPSTRLTGWNEAPGGKAKVLSETMCRCASEAKLAYRVRDDCCVYVGLQCAPWRGRKPLLATWPARCPCAALQLPSQTLTWARQTWSVSRASQSSPQALRRPQHGQESGNQSLDRPTRSTMGCGREMLLHCGIQHLMDMIHTPATKRWDDHPSPPPILLLDSLDTGVFPGGNGLPFP